MAIAELQLLPVLNSEDIAHNLVKLLPNEVCKERHLARLWVISINGSTRRDRNIAEKRNIVRQLAI